MNYMSGFQQEKEPQGNRTSYNLREIKRRSSHKWVNNNLHRNSLSQDDMASHDWIMKARGEKNYWSGSSKLLKLKLTSTVLPIQISFLFALFGSSQSLNDVVCTGIPTSPRQHPEMLTASQLSSLCFSI